MDTDQERVTNILIGEHLGLSHAQISRLRSGTRGTTPERMKRIARLLHWSVDDQITARMAGTYHTEFERHIERWKTEQAQKEADTEKGRKEG